ncbi:MAG: thiamine pyrophosphate-binding protein [Polyangiaceae bacterium]
MEIESREVAHTEVGLRPARNERLADTLVDVLVSAGLEIVFGIPGGAVSPIHDALMSRPEVRVVTSRHESGAMFAAAGYARATEKLGVVLVTSGPGVLSALNGLASAACDSIPMLVIAGDVPRGKFGRGALQDGSAYHLDIVRMTNSITKMAMEVRDPAAAVPMLKLAMETALSGRRGPVLLTLPIDVGMAPAPVPLIGFEKGTPSRAENATLEYAATLLAESERPLILAGSGTRWGEGPTELRHLAELLQVPVVTTPKGKGILPEDHPLSLGVFGFGGHPSAARYLAEGVDTLFVVGSSLGEVATDGFSPLISEAKDLVQLDVDPLSVGRAYPVRLGLIGDAALTMRELTRKVKRRMGPKLRDPKVFGVVHHENVAVVGDGPEGAIQPHRVIHELQTILPRDTIYTSDIGEHLLYAIHYVRAFAPDSFCVMTGLGSMGSGIGASLGQKLATPKRPVVAICGDGCFSMGFGDVATAARERIPILVVVLNDERYGMVEIGHESVYGRRPPYPAGPMDVVKLARGVGASAMRIDHTGDILHAARDIEAMLAEGPVVLDVRIDRTTRMPKNGRNEVLSKGAMKRAFN